MPGTMVDMAQHQWLDRTQPQTLQNAVILCYIDAGLGLLSGLLGGGAGLFLLLAVLLGVGGFGVANEKRWGYWVAVVVGILVLLDALLVMVLAPGLSPVLSLLFAGVLVALLLHPMSRSYQRIWFR